MIALHGAVLDDDLLDIEALRLQLNGIGAFDVQLDAYTDPATMCRAVIAAPVDVLFLDRRLGPVDGMDVLRDLRAAG